MMRLSSLCLAGLLAFGVPALAKETPAKTTPVAKSAKPESKGGEAAKGKEAPAIVALHYGKDNAPVLIEEFASLSCSHCAHFHKDVLPKLKKSLLDGGKALLVTYSYIRNEPDLRGTMLLHCLDNEEQRQQFAGVLFDMQEQWAYAENVTGALGDIAKVGGIAPEKFQACVKDTAYETELMKGLQHISETHDIQGTPTFFINGQKYSGAPEAEPLGKAVELVAGGGKLPKDPKASEQKVPEQKVPEKK